VAVLLAAGALVNLSERGTILWKYRGKEAPAPFIARSREGTCYLGGARGGLTAVNRVGRELWHRAGAPAPVFPALVGWDGRVFVTGAGEIHCYTPSGCLLWKVFLSSPPALPPALDQSGGFFLTLEEGALLQVSPFGEVESRTPQKKEKKPAAAASLEGKKEEKRLVVFYPGGEVFLAENGEERPLGRLPGRPLAAIGRHNQAAAALAGGGVVLLDDTGEVLWRGEAPVGEKEIKMLWDDRGIYVFSPAGAAGFTPEGRRLWIFRLEGTDIAPAFSDEGVLYSGGRDGVLYAYRLEERVRVGERAVLGPLPEGRYYPDLDKTPPPEASQEAEDRLREIGRLVAEDLLGAAEPACTVYLASLALSAVDWQGSGLHPLVMPDQRMEAVRLLSLMGSGEAVALLARVCLGDPDAGVRSAAAEAIGRIGIDPEGKALSAFAALLHPSTGLKPPALLEAVAAAVGALCRFSGPPLSGEGVRLLGILAAPGQDDRVRKAARRELFSLHEPPLRRRD